MSSHASLIHSPLCISLFLALASLGGCIQPAEKPVPEADLDGDGATAEVDCDDGDDRVAPGLVEVCDLLDNDCDGMVDEVAVDAVELYADEDGDGFGDGATNPGCQPDAHHSTVDGDCDDTRADVYPGAEERCDEADQDCDGEEDEQAVDAPVWYLDADSDGYGSTELSMASCTQPEDFVANSDDCGPSDRAVSPEGAEVCDGGEVDEDCDGLIDDADPDVTGTLSWSLDQDGDGLGGADGGVQACSAPRGYVEGSTDCDDADPTVAGPTDLFGDADGDGFGDPAVARLGCLGDEGLRADGTDCDDADPEVWPGAEDAPYDGVDQDCSGGSDYDADGDGYDSDAYGGPDCDDADAAFRPGAAETWYDGVDQDCSGGSDFDSDSDGYESAAWGGADCDDTSALIAPDAAEAPLDGDDQDCDGEDLEDASWLLSTTASARAGYQVAIADLSGDGVPELITSAPYLSSGWLYAMAGDSLPVVDALDSADALVKGVGAGNYLGWSLDARGDLDGDGYTDLLVGEPGVGRTGEVSAFLGPLTSAVTPSSAEAVLTGDWSTGLAGRAVSLAGDVDGDGEQDLVYGAPYASTSGTDKGIAVLVLGPMSSPTDDAAQLEGQYSHDKAGAAVVGAGDTDGDGLDDLAIGAPYNNDQGAAYVMLGPVSGSLELSDADAKVRGDVDGDDLGAKLLGGFDANGDGYGDLWIAATGASIVEDTAGAVYLVYGPFSTKADVGGGDAMIYGEGADDAVGASLWQGDLDGDGAGDLLVGASAEGASNCGMAWALLGPLDGARSVDAASRRWTSATSSAQLGASVTAGDLDLDGQMDVLVGAPGNTPFTTNAGSVFAIYGGW